MDMGLVGHLGPGTGAIGEGKAVLIRHFSPFFLLTLDKKKCSKLLFGKELYINI